MSSPFSNEVLSTVNLGSTIDDEIISIFSGDTDKVELVEVENDEALNQVALDSYLMNDDDVEDFTEEEKNSVRFIDDPDTLEKKLSRLEKKYNSATSAEEKHEIITLYNAILKANSELI